MLIVNAQNDTKCFEDIIEILTEAANAFEPDKELIRINIGLGNMYFGYEGMRCSYEESRNISILQKHSIRSNLVAYNGKKDMVNYYKYTIQDESKLFNCMIKGDVAETNATIIRIVEKNLNHGTDQMGIKFLYQQIYNTAVKVLQAKGITEDSLMQENYINVNAAISIIESEQFIEYIEQFVFGTVSYSDLPSTKLDIKGIIAYVNVNFQSDIYLDGIARQFNTSSKYLSRMIKNI